MAKSSLSGSNLGEIKNTHSKEQEKDIITAVNNTQQKL